MANTETCSHPNDMGEVVKMSELNGVDAAIAHLLRAQESGELIEVAIAGRCSNGDSLACASKNSAQLLGAVHLLAVGMANGIINNGRSVD